MPERRGEEMPAPMPMTVTPIPCLTDNYSWLLRSPERPARHLRPGGGRAGPRRGRGAGGRLEAILLTHHHGDHVAGVAEHRGALPARR
jgi:hydroxyacylglutathione hydrolase